MDIKPRLSLSPAVPAAAPVLPTTAPARSAFEAVVPRNAPGSSAPAATVVPSVLNLSLAESIRRGIALPDVLRLQCLRHGAPATIDHCLQRAPRLPPEHRAMMLQRLTLALADDRRPGSPCGPVDPQADACDTYCLAAARMPPSYRDYQVALPKLHDAIVGCRIVRPGTYGFLRQSVACQSALAVAINAAEVRTALSGWLNWQWAAPSAFATDPQLRARADGDPLQPTRIAFALDQDSVLAMDIMLELRSETGSPAARSGSPAGSAA